MVVDGFGWFFGLLWMIFWVDVDGWVWLWVVAYFSITRSNRSLVYSLECKIKVTNRRLNSFTILIESSHVKKSVN